MCQQREHQGDISSRVSSSSEHFRSGLLGRGFFGSGVSSSGVSWVRLGRVEVGDAQLEKGETRRKKDNSVHFLPRQPGGLSGSPGRRQKSSGTSQHINEQGPNYEHR